VTSFFALVWGMRTEEINHKAPGAAKPLGK